MPTYAAQTSVSAEKSKLEIERTLQRFGADQFLYGWESDRAMIGFRISGRQVRFILPLPPRTADEFLYTAVKRERRNAAGQILAWEQGTRQRWRALALIIKAKLEAIEAGIVTVEDEFLAQTLLPSGESVSEWLQPQVTVAYERGDMPTLLPGGRSDTKLLNNAEGKA